MNKAWESFKRRWEEDPLTTIYMGLGIGMTLYGLYRDLEARHEHAEFRRSLEERRIANGWR